MKILRFNENIKLSNELKGILATINSDTSKLLLSLDGADSDIEDVRSSKNKEFIEFSTTNNNGRFTPIRTGRLVRRIFDENDVKYLQADIEKLINDYKSELDDSEIQIISGKEILNAYNTKNYYTKDSTYVGSSLCGSCMNDEPTYLGLYTDNKCCRLVILKKDGKIAGRAILWSGELDGVKKEFLDRIYGCSDHIVNKIKNWALRNGYPVAKNGSGDDNFINRYVDISDRVYNEAIVKLNKAEFENYPYVDTVRYQYKNILANGKNLIPSNDLSYILNTTGGYRHVYGINTKDAKFEIVKGVDIDKWYNIENYEKSAGFDYTLYNETTEPDDLEFIRDNGRLLIYLNSDNKLLGRCMLITGELDGINTEVSFEPDTLAEGITESIKKYIESQRIPSVDFEADTFFVLGDKKFKNFVVKLDKEYNNFLISYGYYNKTKLEYSTVLNKIEGDFIYYVDMDYKGKQFVEVWKTPKGPIVPSYNYELYTHSEFDNKNYFREDIVHAWLSSSIQKSIITHRDNCIPLYDKTFSKETKWVYKYDSAFNIENFNADPKKTEWLVLILLSKVPFNFKGRDRYRSKIMEDKDVEYNIISDKEIVIKLSHYKYKATYHSLLSFGDKEKQQKKEAIPFDIDWTIKIGPSDIKCEFSHDINSKKVTFYRIRSQSFRYFINNTSSEVFKELNSLCEKIPFAIK